MKLLLALTTIFFVATANAQCRVIDAELQGTYSGGCANGLAEGEGYAKGSAEYQGSFRQGRKHGKGVKTWANGDKYEGAFVDDKREGLGAYTWGRGDWQGERYEGGYNNDQRHGFGTYRWNTGDVYAGPWESDIATGPPTPMMEARKKYEAEARAAVAKEGTRVCRELAVGIGNWEWARGVVVKVDGDKVGVRVEEPGKNSQYKVGEIALDSVTAWIPCL
jgi:hypothetical protein